MAADDDDRGPGPDPWDEIVAGSLGDADGEPSFQFDDAASNADATASNEDPAPIDDDDDVVAPDQVAEDHAAADALVEDWLAAEAGDGASAVPPLAVFPPDESVSGTSDIDIGTGASGIALHGAPEQEEIGGDSFAHASTPDDGEVAGWPSVDTSAGETLEGVGAGGFPGVAPAAATVVASAAAAKVAKRGDKPAKKSGGIGQMIGIALGGVLSIPITLAILIYGLGRDPFGVTKQVPPAVAFLLPAKFQPGYRKPLKAPALVASRPSRDSRQRGSDSVEPVAEPAAGADEPASDAPVAVVDAQAVPAADPAASGETAAEPVVAPVADAGVDPVAAPEADVAADPVVAPAIDPVTDVVAVEPPKFDALAVTADPVAPAPDPVAAQPPLDTLALDEAVGDATALSEALGAVDDKENRAYRLLRTRWYRALARVAEELVAVDHAAATSGRSLAAAPENVAELHGGIGRRESLVAELAALAPDWLAYAKRGSDGVVLPVTFESTRKVGPYWTTKATLTAADGTARDLTIVSRSEPTAIAGERLVVTGVVLDGAVVWAADVRGADAGSSQPSF